MALNKLVDRLAKIEKGLQKLAPPPSRVHFQMVPTLLVADASNTQRLDQLQNYEDGRVDQTEAVFFFRVKTGRYQLGVDFEKGVYLDDQLRVVRDIPLEAIEDHQGNSSQRAGGRHANARPAIDAVDRSRPSTVGVDPNSPIGQAVRRAVEARDESARGK